MFLSIFPNCCIVSSCLIHLYSYTTCLYILICLLPFKSRNSMCEFRKLNTNLLVSCFSYKCSEERRHGLLSIWQWQPVATLLKIFLKNSCQKCFKYFFFSSSFFPMLLDTCTSISHSISSREKAQCDSGAPQSEKTGTWTSWNKNSRSWRYNFPKTNILSITKWSRG